MDKPEVRLRRPLYGIIILLNRNELLNHVNLGLCTHVFRLCSSTDIVIHALKYSGRLAQTWVGLQDCLQQNTSTNPFIYCEIEQDLWCEESDDHPSHLEEKTTGGGLTFGRYVKVQSAPYTYDQGGKAKGNNPKGAPLVWFSHPQIWGIAGSSDIGCRVLHLLTGQ
jgi:hypothetical protein